MSAVVHYVGGPRDGDNELSPSRPAERDVVHVGHGRAPVSYSLYLVEADCNRTIFVYAASGMPLDVIKRIVSLRLAAR
jgi:hypothetical protein